MFVFFFLFYCLSIFSLKASSLPVEETLPVLEHAVSSQMMPHQKQDEHYLGTSLFFQKLPLNNFLMISHFSNILFFSVPDMESMQEKKQYKLLVAKLLMKIPFSASINKNSYIAFISNAQQNDWSIFTGFDQNTTYPLTLSMGDETHSVLKVALNEMNLLFPSHLANVHSYEDLSILFPLIWEEVLLKMLSPLKGNNSISIHEDETNLLPADQQSQIPFYCLFPKIEKEEDKFVDVFSTLAYLQPFSISLRVKQQLMQKYGADLSKLNPFQYACYPMYFEENNKNNPGYCPIKHLAQPCLTYEKLALVLKNKIKEKIQNAKPEDLLTINNPACFFNLMTLKTLYHMHKNAKIPLMDGISLFALKNFITNINNRAKKMTETLELDAKAMQDIIGLMNQNPSLIEDSGKSNIERFIQKVELLLSSSSHHEELLKGQESFGKSFFLLEEDGIMRLFEQQTPFMGNLSGKSDKKIVAFEQQLHYLMKCLDVFAQLHKDFYHLGQKMHIFLFLNQSVTEDQAQIKKPIYELYEEYQKIILSIRKIYSQFGYLNVDKQKNEQQNDVRNDDLPTPSLQVEEVLEAKKEEDSEGSPEKIISERPHRKVLRTDVTAQ